MTFTAGSRLGPYEIQSALGAGGMGEVYRARDPRLNRTIAIKILPGHTATDPERRARFEREAQSIAALSHPNVVTIYSVEEADGVLFLTMEYVEGKPLSELIGKGGLALTQILHVAIPLADGIAAAHQKGITHRDLKPDNVIVTPEGRVKVLDFGLAKLLEAAPVELTVTGLPAGPLTSEGRIVGTAAYMSPEQAEGKPVDHRSDLFSIGIILYELATGERPFTGDTNISVLSSIVRDMPRRVTDLKPALPRELWRIIKHCLVKDPEYRYQSTKDLRNELRELQQDSESGELEIPRDAHGPGAPGAARRRAPRIAVAAGLMALAIAGLGGWLWLGRSPAGTPIDSLAVLPFDNVGSDANTEYLSDGITENLINNLSQLPALRVVPRSTAFRYKGQDLQKAKRELGVRAVLTGRVVQRGDALKIQTDLIDLTEDAQLWGGQYTRTLADLITVQDEIATAVSAKLRLRPTVDDQKRLAGRHTENPEAQLSYLQGLYYWNRRTQKTLPQAVEAFRHAIDKDPGYALAWAGLADSYGLYGSFAVGSPREFGPRANDAAQAALRIDKDLPEAHVALSWIRIEERDWPGARSEIDRAIALDPHSGTAYQRLAACLLVDGRTEESLAAYQRANQLEPMSSIISTLVGRGFYHVRRYREAVDQLEKTLQLDPNFPQAHLILGWAYEQQARYEDAITELRKAFTLSDGESEVAGALGHAYAVAGMRSEAQKALATLKERSSHEYIAPYDIALIYVGLGEKTSAFAWLEKAYQDHSHWLIWIKVDPRFDGIRDDPRYHDLLRRMKVPE